MSSLQQVRTTNKKMYYGYLKDFFEEPVNFQNYVNFELGAIFDKQHTIISVTFLKKNTAFIVYAMKI